MLPRLTCRYVLWRLVKLGQKSILYEYPKGFGSDVPMFIPTGSAAVTGLVDICIADGCEPREGLDVRTLLISSPRGSGPAKSGTRPVYDVFQNHAAPLYMPAPSESEIMLMAKHCFPQLLRKIGMAELQARISRWGPVPRYVLSSVGDEEAKLAQAIASQKVGPLRDLVATMSERIVVDDVSFRVVHYVIDPTYTSVSYDWASPEIGGRVVERLAHATEGDRFQLLADMLKHKHLLKMSHPLWEAWCDLKMAGYRQDGSGPLQFRVRRLGVGSVKGGGSGYVVPKHPDQAQLFKDADKRLDATIIADGTGTVTFPRAKNTGLLKAAADLPAAGLIGGKRFRARACFATADFIETNGICTNATVNPAHTVVLLGKTPTNGLLPIMRRLYPTATWNTNSSSPVPFVFLVPPIIFDECTAGQMVIEPQPKAASSTDFDDAMQLSRWVVQYAVEIPAPSEHT
jgi:hypothetical protein